MVQEPIYRFLDNTQLLWTSVQPVPEVATYTRLEKSMHSAGFEPAIAAIKWTQDYALEPLGLHSLNFPTCIVTKTSEHKWIVATASLRNAWQSENDISYRRITERPKIATTCIHGRKGLRESIRALIFQGMLQCEKPTNMRQCTWPSKSCQCPTKTVLPNLPHRNFR